MSEPRDTPEAEEQVIVTTAPPCRFGCASPAAAIVYYPQGCICWPDVLQALCGQHVVDGIQNNDGSVVAWLDPAARAVLEPWLMHGVGTADV